MPIAFEHDCREGICGSCGVMINGKAHGGFQIATCQVRMRQYPDGAELYVEPWRSRAFVIIRDLVVDRSPLDAIIQAGGYISVSTGSAPEANLIPVAEGGPGARDGRGRVHRLRAPASPSAPTAPASSSPPPRSRTSDFSPRVSRSATSASSAMVETMEQYFGSCTNFRECEAVCPKSISIDFIAKMNRDYFKAQFTGAKKT